MAHVPGSKRTVFRYDFVNPPHEGEAVVYMPERASVLSADILYDGTMAVWAVLATEDTTVELKPRVFVVVNTGAEFSEELIRYGRFVGTVRSASGIVWHVWEKNGQVGQVPV